MGIVKSLSLSTKLIVTFVLIGMIPVTVLGLRLWATSQELASSTGGSYQTIAASIMDKIDRNLFERYGDVQAFGVNDAVLQKSNWYQVGSAKNRIAAVANQYANLYGFYVLSIMVDLDGKVVSVNDKDPSEKPIDSAWLYQKNFKDSVWFKETMAGHFLKTATLDGTFVEDVYADEDVRKIYGGDGLVLGFSAPVKDANGKIIGIWNNRAVFSLVEEFYGTAYRDLKSKNLASAELTLLDRTGRVLIDYDPKSNKGDENVKHDPAVFQKLNLAEKGVQAAKEVVAGRSGSGRALHARKQIWQTSGYAASTGALGFAGLKWGVMVRVDEAESLALVHSIRAQLFWIMCGSVTGLLVVSAFLGRVLSRPLVKGLQEINEAGETVASASSQVSSASQSLAQGASEQAAGLEETSSAIEEMASMTRKNADTAQSASQLSAESQKAASQGNQAMKRMSDAINEIEKSASQTAKIIKVIDEIAFQTNLLALNAAVEAARAGEAGKGFAVVASEVRNLAIRSAEAAKNTSSLIEQSVTSAKNGVSIAAEVAKTLNEITESTTKVHGLLGEIAAASGEQSRGIDQVNSSVSQIDKVTQQNAAGAEESASASAQLAEQAIHMGRVVQDLLKLVSGARSDTAVEHETQKAA